MTYIYLYFFIVTIFSCQVNSIELFKWFWNSPKDDTNVLVADGVPLISIPYEAMTEDEKFLQEAAKFTNIQVSSPLETCQHKVIMQLRTSCSDMTEEQLAKLSVNLLNCQSMVEGRKIFPCSEEMSLKQCTTDMDADMWNAYHLMSNRARAVCYAARSTQFRALTELTVNKLMQSAHSQITVLSSLKEGQNRLEEHTTEVLSSLTEGNKALLLQQQHLRDAQAIAHKFVSMNLRDLNNEKALIKLGHAQLAAMAEDIRNKLEKASQDLVKQSIERGTNHKELLQDLVNIQEQAQLIWDKIESSTNLLLDRHEQAVDQYEEMLQKLVKINDTIQFIWNVTNTMRTEVDEKLAWITGYIGDTGEQLQKMYRITLHIIYILVAMIAAAFLHAPFITRISIMGIIPINLISYLKHGLDACLDFPSITALIFLITGMHFVMIGVQYIFRSKENPIKLKKLQQPVKGISQNGLSNGKSHECVSSSHSNLMLRSSFLLLVKQTVQKFYGIMQDKIIYLTVKVASIIQSVTFWNQRDLSQQEELSCSYTKTKKNHEDIIDYDYQNVTDDITDMETSDINYRSTNDDDLESLVDANELRHRLKRVNSLTSNINGRQSSMNRSMTPTTYATPRILCNAVTRSGRKCRLVASQGRGVCSRHITGSSIISN